MEEAVSGVKGELATKVYGDDLQILEDKANEVAGLMRQVKGIEDLGVFRVLGQPNLNVTVDRQQAARYQINVADVQDAIQTAVGGNALTQVLQGEARYDLVCAICPNFGISEKRFGIFACFRLTASEYRWRSFAKSKSKTVLLKFTVKATSATSPSSTAFAAATLAAPSKRRSQKVNEKVKLPTGYHIDWEGEYASQKRSSARLLLIVPITVFLIFMIIYGAFGSAKWALLNLVTVLVAPFGGLLALLVTGTHFSVSSGVGFLALFGVCVQTGVIMVEYINQLRARGMPVRDSRH